MKIITIILVLHYFNLVQFIDTKKYRVIVDEELLPYIPDMSVASYRKYISTNNIKLELIDDSKMLVGGYSEFINSMDPNLPYRGDLRTQYYQGSWQEGMFRLVMPNFCAEYVNPTRFWYNITKLWTDCPPMKGVKWMIEEHEVNMIIDLPPSIPIVPWRAFFLMSQGMPGIETIKFGMGFCFEFQLV